MAASLAALGIPVLQARWWLALSVAGYTLAAAVWSVLLPRLVPDVATLVQSRRHRLAGERSRLAEPLPLAYARACKAHSKLWLARTEGVAIIICTPLLGWLIGRLGSVDAVLVSVGVAFALVLVCATLIWMLMAFAHGLAQAPLALRRRGQPISGKVFPMLETAPHR